jgi:hypothetical protein
MLKIYNNIEGGTMRKNLLILACVFLLTGVAFSQNHGDYMSNVSGNWGTLTTWVTYDTVSTSWVAAVAQPTSTNNVTIKTGDSVRVDASGKNCLNLTIQSGAKIYTTTTTNTYINIYGTTLTNDGVMEGSANGLSINFGFINDLTMQGTGVADISRIRPNGTGNYGITFDQDVNLHFVGAALYVNGKPNTTFTINAGKTLSFGVGSFFAYGTSSASATGSVGNIVVNIDGNMIMQNGSNFNVSVTTGNTSTVNINGMLSAGDSIMSNGTGSEVFNIYTGGQLLFPNTDTLTFMDSLNFYDPSGLYLTYPITVAGKLGLMSGAIDSAYYIKMLDNSTIERVAGRLNGAPIFMNSVNLIYYWAYPCTTGYEMPTNDIVQNLTVNNSGGLTMDETVMVNGNLYLTDGIIEVPGTSNYLGVAGDVVRTSGYVIGTMGRVVPAGASVSRAFDLGTASGYSPVTLNFNTVTKQGMLGVRTVASTAPDVTIPENCMLRYWDMGMRPDSLIEFDYYDLTLSYLPFDFNTGFTEAADEPSMAAGRHDSIWTFPVIGTRNSGGVADGGSVVLDSLAAFGVFTLAKDQDAINSEVDSIAPFVTGVSPSFGATDVGLNEAIIIAFSEPMDTSSFSGYTDPFHDFTPSWNAACDTFTLTPQYSYSYGTTMLVIITDGTDLSSNPLEFLPDTVISFTTIDNVGPSITLIEQPGDTYDGTGPFPVRAVFTDATKAGIAADTLWYSDNKTDWWAIVHESTDGDTFNYNIPGSFAAGSVIEFFFGVWDDGGAVQYDPSMYKGYQFRILDPLPPTGLVALAGDKEVSLSWNPPAEVLSYSTSNVTGTFEGAGDIVDTRFTPQHYPCKLEQALSSWWYAIGSDSIVLHVWGDNGEGLPDRSTDLIPPVTFMPSDMEYTVIDLSAFNLTLTSGDFHIGYVIRTDNLPMPLCDGDGPGLRSLVFDSSANSWSNLILSGDQYRDWSHQAVVSYIAPSLKGISLKSYIPNDGSKQLAPIAAIKFKNLETQLPATYPKLDGALYLAKNITGYDILRSDVSGGPYDGWAKLNGTSFVDTMVSNGNTYYYVVRALYESPDTLSNYSNEASATPTGVEGKPGIITHILQLNPVTPNPVSNGKATFRYSIPAVADVTLDIFNVLGQKINTLVNEKQGAGSHTVYWNGTDRSGQKLSSGVYIYQLKTMGKALTKRMTIIR